MLEETTRQDEENITLMSPDEVMLKEMKYNINPKRASVFDLITVEAD